MKLDNIYDGLEYADFLKAIGVDGVRVHVSSGSWSVTDPRKHGEALELLRRFDSVAPAEEAARREEREERMLAIAEEANSISRKARSDARRANKIATVAIVLSTATAIIAAVIGVMFEK